MKCRVIKISCVLLGILLLYQIVAGVETNAIKFKPLAFTEIQLGGEGESSNQLYSIYGLDCDRDGNIYLLDGKANRIVVIDDKGHFLRKILRKGKGPNEISNPIRFSFNTFTNTIFILQEFGYSLKEFDKEGNFIRLYRTPEQFFGFFKFIDNHRLLYVAKKKPGEGKYNNLKVFNIKTQEIEKESVPSTTDTVFNIYQRFVLKDNCVWTVSGDKMQMRGYHLPNGKMIDSLDIEGDFKKNKILQINENGMTGMRPIFYNFAQPFLLYQDLCIIVTIQTYPPMDDKGFPTNCKIVFYRMIENQFETIGYIDQSDPLSFGTVYKAKVIFYANDPYPLVKVVKIK
jgi:6-bladed beta-propeller